MELYTNNSKFRIIESTIKTSINILGLFSWWLGVWGNESLVVKKITIVTGEAFYSPRTFGSFGYERTEKNIKIYVVMNCVMRFRNRSRILKFIMIAFSNRSIHLNSGMTQRESSLT